MPDGWGKPPSLADVIVPAEIERQKAILDAEKRLNSLGWQVGTKYDTTHNKFPDADCTDVTWDRVMLAADQVRVALPHDKASNFGRLWYSYINDKRTWLSLPWEYRGAGAAGAMAYSGLGRLVDQAGIWAGKLQ